MDESQGIRAVLVDTVTEASSYAALDSRFWSMVTLYSDLSGMDCNARLDGIGLDSIGKARILSASSIGSRVAMLIRRESDPEGYPECGHYLAEVDFADSIFRLVELDARAYAVAFSQRHGSITVAVLQKRDEEIGIAMYREISPLCAPRRIRSLGTGS